MNLNRDEVLTFMREHSDRPMKVKELAKAYGLTRARYQEFRTIILELLHSGELVRLKGGRIGLAAEMNILVGPVSVTRMGVGFVPDEGESDVMIPASQMHTALHGDKVMVRRTGVRGDRPIGSIIRVQERSERNVVGVFHQAGDFSYVTPDSPRCHRDIFIPPRAALESVDGEKVVARLTIWDDPHLNPQGEVIERLGFPGDPGVDMLTVMRSHDLPQEFSDDVLIEAENAAVMPPAAELCGRTDFTKDCIYTIDPADAKDHDDACSVEKLGTGFRLGVHIADVSHFVQPGTAVDKEAFERGNSVYLPGTVIPMIPEILSNDLCSLKPNRRRLAHSVVIDFDRRGKMLRWEMHDSLVKSRAKLSYEEVQAFFDGKEPSARVQRVAENLKVAQQLAKILSHRRLAQGSLDFDLPEAKIVMDAKGEVLALGSRIRLESHRLVEEFMLAANRAVALEIFRKGEPLLYRVHAKPEMEKLNDFSNMMTRLGLKFPVSPSLKPIHFARFLEKVQGRPDTDFINELMLRSMQKAVYQRENVGHFGLAFTHYAHFTSPIRRYPDLLIHRLLRQLEGGKYPPAFASKVVSVIDNVGQHCSETERNAEKAEREAIRVKQVAYMARHVGDEFQGVISGVTGYGFFVRLEGLGAEGLVRLSSLDNDYYQYEDKRFRLVGKRTGRIYRLGDSVRVGVQKVDKVSNEIDLFVVDEKRRAPKKSTTPARKSKKTKGLPAKGKKQHRKRKSKKSRGHK